jgi:hypothetical protein
MKQTENTMENGMHVRPAGDPLAARWTRRRLLAQMAGLGAAVVGVGLLAGCGGGDDGGGESASVALGEPVVCDDATLSEQDRTRRQAVHYVDLSPQRGKTCSQCRFFKPAQDEDDGCGKCDILAGPVAAAGYCNAYVQR